jgi:hypothetical protein
MMLGQYYEDAERAGRIASRPSGESMALSEVPPGPNALSLQKKRELKWMPARRTC